MKIFKILVSFLLLFSFSYSFSYTSLELDAANFLASEGIIKFNSDKIDDYRLDNTITRKETMKIVMNMSGFKINDICEKKFDDVLPDWGCKYIESALNYSFISKNNNKFRPDDNITKTEAMKLVFKARGIEKTFSTGDWQKDYMETAYAKGLIEEKYYDYNSDATRGWIFLLSKKAFDYSKDFKILIPTTNPFITFDDLVTIEGIAPIGIVDKILVNGYKLTDYDNTQSYFKYYANSKYGNLNIGENKYKFDFYNRDNKILISKNIIIIKKDIDLNSATYSDEANIK